jgi:ABC-2 type transport system ATP-binding protein
MMIKAEHLSKTYGRVRALDDLSFTVEKGEVTAFLGANGAGKSTTMNIITGYISAGSGEVSVDGLDITRHAEEVRSRIGYLPEQPPLYSDLTVNEYMNFVAGLKRQDKKTAGRERDAIYEMTGLTEVRRRLIRNLSKGYRQRLGFAQALVGFPPLLILDEPTAGLDPQQIIEVRSLINRLRKKHTIVLSSHILSEVQNICDRALIISRGRLVANDTPGRLAKKIAGGNGVLVRVIGDEEAVMAALKEIKEVRQVEKRESSEAGTVDFEVIAEEASDVRLAVFKAVVAAGGSIIGLRAKDISLEEVFLSLTKQAGGEKS